MTDTKMGAFARLRRAGLRFDDPDIVKALDLTDPAYVNKAKADHPDWFLPDARTLGREDYKTAKAIVRGERPPRAAEGSFDALKASPADYEQAKAAVLRDAALT